MALQIGDLVSQRYRIGSVLAQSEGETLYRAQDKISGTDVLFKEFSAISSQGGAPDKAKAGLLISLQHPNLVPVSDHFTIAGRGTYVVLDTAGSESLRQRMEKTGALLYNQVLPLLLNICDAIFYLHDRQPPLVHGNIGLDTVFLNTNGKVSLLFTGEPYTAVEETGISADVFALGKTAYNLLTNEPPPETSARKPKKQKKKHLKSYLARNFAQIPPTIAMVITQSIDPDPERRFGSSEDFKAALLYALVQGPPDELRTSPVNLPLENSVRTEGSSPITSAEPQDHPSPAVAPPEPTTPIRRRVPWGLL